MCRLVGIVASETTPFGRVLKEAPRSLAILSKEHPDGWGVAVHGEQGWSVERGTARAGEDDRFHAAAVASKGAVLIAHIRQKTVGPTRLENTHPFTRDGWVFAHNGTVTAVDLLRERTSKARLAEIEGDTDSEVLFAFLLTRLDEAGFLRLATVDRERATALLAAISRELREAKVGAFNYLLSDGATLFAHRSGRSLYVLERAPSQAGKTPRRQAVFVASEKLTDEPWVEIDDGSLLRVDRAPAPSIAWAVTAATRNCA